jgi:hypothetical protein
VQHTLDLEVHVQVLEIDGVETRGDGCAEAGPGRFFRVGVVAEVRGYIGFPELGELGGYYSVDMSQS